MEAGKQEVGERGGSPTQTAGEADAMGCVQQTVIEQLSTNAKSGKGVVEGGAAREGGVAHYGGRRGRAWWGVRLRGGMLKTG